jgi:hypothetical protein
MKFSPILLSPISLFALALLPACQSSDHRNDAMIDKHVDDSMLANVSKGDRNDINDAREAADAARDSYAAAKIATTRATDRRHLADRDLEVAQAEVKRADEALALAQHGTQDDLDRATKARADAATVADAARSRIDLRDRQVAYAKAYENVKQQNNNLAQAKVEAVKAHAVAKLNRPEAHQIDVAAFEQQVRAEQEAVNVAQVKLDAAKKEVAASREMYDTDVKAVPSAYKDTWPKEEPLPKD